MKKNNQKSNYTQILCRGNNTSKIINSCISSGITLKNLNKKVGQVSFEVSDKDLKIFQSINQENYQVEIIRVGGARKALNIILERIGVIVGLLIVVLSIFISKNMLFQIHILGLDNVKEDCVVKELNNYGLTKYSYMNFNKTDLENYLYDKFDFSFVSIKTKGNSLIISVKESLPDISNKYVPITAENYMVIKSINVYAGTCNVGVGDIIYKGDILVQPYIKRGNDIVYVEPCAEIVADIYYTASLYYKNKEVITKRTGKWQNVSSDIELGRWKILSNKYSCKFTEFEVEENSNCISNYFLPLKIKKQVAYELIKEEVENNFEENKEKIINSLKKDAYSQVSINDEIKSEEIVINEVIDGYLVNVYLISEKHIHYKNNIIE